MCISETYIWINQKNSKKLEKKKNLQQKKNSTQISMSSISSKQLTFNARTEHKFPIKKLKRAKMDRMYVGKIV